MRPRLKLINSLLLGAILLINGYIIAAPLLPRLSFWWQSTHTHRRQQLDRLVSLPAVAAVQVQPNSLIIPAMLLNQPTLEAPKSDWFTVLKAGVWRWPDSSTPDKGGNTVFLAHRFSYTGPRGAFYSLDKLHAGDTISLTWNNKKYTYSVISSGEVPPTDTAIEANTPDARLTLFTCTPLWHPIDRLVVIATLEKSS